MRYALFALILLALLAGCAAEQPAPLPTAAGLEPTAEAAVATAITPAAPAAGEATPLPPLNITVPPPGVIVTAVVTAEPPDGPGFDTSARFESLIFQQTGGLNNLDLLIEIAADGSVRRDGAAVSVAPETVAAIDQKLKEVDFFNIQGQFTTVGGPSSDQYRYRLSVQQDGAGRSINAQDGYTPPILLELFTMIAALGESTP